MDKLLAVFESAITTLFPANRLGQSLRLGFLALIVFSSGWIWNSITGDFTLRRLEKQISLLKELNDLNQSNISQAIELQPIYTRLITELRDYNPSIQMPSELLSNPKVSQFLNAGWIWYAIALFMLFFGGSSINTRLLSATVAVICGVISGFIYTAIYSLLSAQPSNSAWDFVIPTGFSILLLLILGYYGNKNSKKPVSQPTSTP